MLQNENNTHVNDLHSKGALMYAKAQMTYFEQIGKCLFQVRQGHGDAEIRGKGKMKKNRLLLLFMWLVMGLFYPAIEAKALSDVEVQFFSKSGVTWEQLSAGATGEGTLLYYLPERGFEKPSLVVHLIHEEGAESAVAEVFHAPPDLSYVPVQFQGDEVILDPALVSVIRIEVLDGWWVRDGLINYNLDIQITGPISAMWGAGYDADLGPQSWAELIQPGQLAASIMVRDPEYSGIPKWDLRLLEPAFPNQGYYRSNYAERKCDTPTEVDLGLSPLWPYVAVEGGYELDNGRLRPPIVVNWNKGEIAHFSEIVTVRNQNCTYSFYSINPLEPDKLNKPNFETPFAFYDLSGEGKGYPNLLLRTQRHPAHDSWMGGLDKDMVKIRYSWRNIVGDWHWDYKIEVLGFHPYSDTTSIADGLFQIDAPPYETFPEWVTSKEWPVVTFIDPEYGSYRSSEGLYEWPPADIGLEYVLGWKSTTRPQAFSKIPLGLRGEYRFQRNLTPTLYLTPIDNRVHLLGADAGVWNISGNVVVRLHNLDGGLYINGWTREQLSVNLDEYEEEEDPDPQIPIETLAVEEAFYHLEGHLLYSSPEEVVLRQADVSSSILDILPPNDQPTWRSFKEQVEPITSQKRDPLDFKSWLNDFPGESLIITKARLFDVTARENGFRFVLELQPDFEIQPFDWAQEPQNALFDTSDLASGQYIVTYNGQWTVEPATLPELSITLTLPEEEEKLSIVNEIPIQALVENRALRDVNAVRLVGEMSQGENTLQITKQEIDLLSGELIALPLNLHPKSAGEWTLRFWLEDQEENILLETSQPIIIPDSQKVDGAMILSVSTRSTVQLVVLWLLFAFAISMMSALFIAQRKSHS